MSPGDPRAGSPSPPCTEEAAGGTWMRQGPQGGRKHSRLGVLALPLRGPTSQGSPRPRERLAGQRGGAPSRAARARRPVPRRDAQRAEELCAKNRQLREQQRALKENLRALENRWGA